jgi:hypothetical protein
VTITAADHASICAVLRGLLELFHDGDDVQSHSGAITNTADAMPYTHQQPRTQDAAQTYE